jgi:sugar phosphate isomerase/epimerase
MKLGVCADPQYGAALADAGFEFLELHVQNHLKTLEDETAFEAERARIQGTPIRALAANCFVPGSLKITGSDVNMGKLEEYVDIALSRAERAGIETIVFGSGGARRIPEGYDRGEAWKQLVAFGKMVGPVAEAHKVTIVVEPLNVRECNVLTTVGESGRYVQEVDHPSFLLLVDAYHWLLDKDSFDDIVRYGPLLRHVHIATEASRLPPGFEPCDFGEFFRALRLAGYDGPVSIEGRWEDIEAQAGEAYGHLERIVGGKAGPSVI